MKKAKNIAKLAPLAPLVGAGSGYSADSIYRRYMNGEDISAADDDKTTQKDDKSAKKDKRAKKSANGAEGAKNNGKNTKPRGHGADRAAKPSDFTAARAKQDISGGDVLQQNATKLVGQKGSAETATIKEAKNKEAAPSLNKKTAEQSAHNARVCKNANRPGNKSDTAATCVTASAAQQAQSHKGTDYAGNVATAAQNAQSPDPANASTAQSSEPAALSKKERRADKAAARAQKRQHKKIKKDAAKFAAQTQAQQDAAAALNKPAAAQIEPKSYKISFLYAFRYMRPALIIMLAPLVAYILRNDLRGALTDLLSNILFIAAIALLIGVLYAGASVTLGPSAITFTEGVLIRRQNAFALADLTCVSLERPLLYRALGATRISLFFKANSRSRRFKVVLKKEDARDIATQLLPCRKLEGGYSLRTFDMVMFVILTADILTGAIIAYTAYRQVSNILGDAVVQGGRATLEHFAGTYIGGGLAVMFAFIAFLYATSFINGLLKVYHFNAFRSERTLISVSGLFTTLERRINLDHLISCDVKITLLSRIFRQSPVFLSAAGYVEKTVPIMMLKNKDADSLQKLIPFAPGFSGNFNTNAKRTIFEYLPLPAGAAGFFTACYLIAARLAPTYKGLFLILVIVALLALLIAIEAFLKEGILIKSGSMVISHSRMFSRNVSAVFGEFALTYATNSIAYSNGRCSIKVRLPARKTYRVRGVKAAFFPELEAALRHNFL